MSMGPSEETQGGFLETLASLQEDVQELLWCRRASQALHWAQQHWEIKIAIPTDSKQDDEIGK